MTSPRSLLVRLAGVLNASGMPWMNLRYIGEGALFGPCGEVGPCSTGAGPVYDASAFFQAGTSILLPWLHTSEDRRTNIVLINPDSGVATVRVTA